MGQLRTEAISSLKTIVARNGVSGDSGGMGDLTMMYAPEQPMLLNVHDLLGDCNVAGARQGTVLKKSWQQLTSVLVHPRRERGFSANDASLSTCEMKIMSLLVTGVPFVQERSCTQALLAKLARSIRKSLTVLVIAWQ